MTTLFRASLRPALIMLGFAVFGTALLAYTFERTRAPIARSEEAEKLALLMQVIPRAAFDNDLVRDTASVEPHALLGTREATRAYRARLNGRPAAVAFEAVAPDGYSGKIRLLLAVRENGEIAGVRVIAHKETPGLGDYIEIAKSRWITAFDRKSLAHDQPETWKVKKDGGRFDYMAGATVTPRAVVKAVKKALEYYQQNKERLFAQEGTRK